MQWDLGLRGLAVLAAMSLGFGLVAHLVMGRQAPRWIWAAATGAYLLLGVVISEIWFGWATEAELQPNIDGLSFDEVLLGMVPAIGVVFAIRYVVRRRSRASGPSVR